MEQHRITIDVMNFAAIDKKIKKLAAKAKKYGNDDITIEYGEPYMMSMTKESGYQTKMKVVDVVVTGTAPVVDSGWEFVARVELLGEGGNLIYNFSNKEVDARFRNHNNNCEHCNKARRRNDVYVFEKEGEQIAVGRQCLKDFLGSQDPAMVVYRAAFFEKLDVMEDDMIGNGSSIHYSTYDVLSVASASVREKGFISKKMALDMSVLSTSDLVQRALSPKGSDDEIEVKDEDHNLATEVKNFFIESSDFKNEYMQNLKVLIGEHEYTNNKHIGMVASSINAYLKVREEAKQRSEVVSKYVGEVKQRLRNYMVDVVSEIYLGTGSFGDKYLYKMIDANGNHFAWFTQKQDLKQGDEIIVDMTVKAHNEFKEIQQTVVTRVKVIKKGNK